VWGPNSIGKITVMTLGIVMMFFSYEPAIRAIAFAGILVALLIP
jgi:hypothetical protein